ncbi:MAG: hypothetical protein ACXWUG_15480 [Polyangiales bacterium]
MFDASSTDTLAADTLAADTATSSDASAETAALDSGSPADTAPTTLDLHDVTLFDNPPDLADWPVTTTLTEVDFSADGVHLEFSKRDGTGSWPDITPPGWDGPLEYTVGLVEYIDGKWYGSAAIQFWRGLDASGGNLAEDVATKAQCTAFGHDSSCQVAKNWYYDARWGNLAGYQPKTGEVIGVFVVAGNVRGVKDGSQSPVHERSNIVLVPMPDLAGAKHAF